MNCITIALDHWSKVREVELTIGPKQGGGGGAKTTNEPPTDPANPPKKRRRKNKKGKDTKPETDGIAAAAKDSKAPPTAPKDPQKSPHHNIALGVGRRTIQSRPVRNKGTFGARVIWTSAATRLRLVACGGRLTIF